MIGVPKTRFPEGFTLVELIASTAIFLVIMLAALNTFGYILRIQNEQLATQGILDNVRATLEIMTRAIRQADPNSLSTTNCPGNINCLVFTHPTLGAMAYELSGTTIGKKNDPSIIGPGFPMTTRDIVVDRLSFVISGADASDQQQPMVTINVQLHPVSQPAKIMSFQTTATLRNLQE
jgi:prepilin-type N-terminal cleavage/methylation domain-containing protein